MNACTRSWPWLKITGHDCFHVNWLGLSGEADWDLMPRIVAGDFTFVTNNARDFRKLYSKEDLHAGLLIIVPQVLPVQQRELFTLSLSSRRKFLQDLALGLNREEDRDQGANQKDRCESAKDILDAHR